jgi:hypothetical protein
VREAAGGAALCIIGAVAVGAFPVIWPAAAGSGEASRKFAETFPSNALYVHAIFPQMDLSRFPSITVSGVNLLIDPLLWLRLTGRGLLRTLLVFHRGDMVEAHYISGSLGGPLISALLLPGLALLVRRWQEPAPAMTLIWFFVCLFGLSVFNAGPPQWTHLVAITPSLAIVYAYLLAELSRFVMRHVADAQAAAVAALTASAVAVFCVLGAREYFTNANTYFTPTLDVLIWFETLDMEGDDTVVFLYQDPQYEGYVPWGVNAFHTGTHFVALPDRKLGELDGLQQIRSAEVIFIAPNDHQTLMFQLIGLLPGWRFEELRDRSGALQARVVRPPVTDD